MNAAAYIRVSTDDQIEFSPASQLNQIHIYAENHQLLLLDSYIYMDEGISGRTAARRPAFLKMISAARETPRPFDVILVWKYSRFARSRQDSIFYKSLLRRECGINVISITEGQIFLETSLFNEGVRPAINVGVSVSRVGGNAQVKAMKKIAGTLKIDQAQYRELESFSKFGGDLDPVTQMVIDKGQKNARLLIQPQYSPMPVEEEIAVIYCGTKGLLQRVPLKNVIDFEKYFLEILRARYRKEVLDELRVGHLDDVVAALLDEVAREVSDKFAVQDKQKVEDVLKN